jgi:hypothetical protein
LEEVREEGGSVELVDGNEESKGKQGERGSRWTCHLSEKGSKRKSSGKRKEEGGTTVEGRKAESR